MSTSKDAWNEVGDRFTAVGKRLAGHYGSVRRRSTKETQHKVEEVVREIGNQLGRALEAVDDTVRDDAARQDLKQAFNALGSAISIDGGGRRDRDPRTERRGATPTRLRSPRRVGEPGDPMGPVAQRLRPARATPAQHHPRVLADRLTVAPTSLA
jgi:hypothetical protein